MPYEIIIKKTETEKEKNEPLKSILGYPPEREVSITKETEILKQTVESLDLAAVIKAINNL